MTFIKDIRTLLLITICIVIGIFLLYCPRFTEDNILLALLTGLFTGVLTVLLLDMYDKVKYYLQLSPLSSNEWIGYNIKERKAINFKIQKEGNGEIEYNSYATIKYQKANILSVCLRHKTKERSVDERLWNGIIEINKEFMTKGLLTYKYTDSHEVGCREVIIHKDTENLYIYFIPANNRVYSLEKTNNSHIPEYDYGIEVLIKKR
jgi:hypothetical protein